MSRSAETNTRVLAVVLSFLLRLKLDTRAVDVFLIAFAKVLEVTQYGAFVPEYLESSYQSAHQTF